MLDSDGFADLRGMYDTPGTILVTDTFLDHSRKQAMLWTLSQRVLSPHVD